MPIIMGCAVGFSIYEYSTVTPTKMPMSVCFQHPMSELKCSSGSSGKNKIKHVRCNLDVIIPINVMFRGGGEC